MQLFLAEFVSIFYYSTVIARELLEHSCTNCQVFQKLLASCILLRNLVNCKKNSRQYGICLLEQDITIKHGCCTRITRQATLGKTGK